MEIPSGKEFNRWGNLIAVEPLGVQSLEAHLDYVREAFVRQSLTNYGEITQEGLRQILTPVIFAGTGSTGFAAIQGIYRNISPYAGFFLDPDTYEISNVPRQVVSTIQVGQNKAKGSAHCARALSPSSMIYYNPDGVDRNLEATLLEIIDYTNEVNAHNKNLLQQQVWPVVFDSIDVTSKGGWNARFLLHELLLKYRIRAFGAYDLGHHSLIFNFPYDQGWTRPFNGRVKFSDGATAQDYNMQIMPKMLGIIPDVPEGYAREYVHRLHTIQDMHQRGDLTKENMPGIKQEATAGALFQAMAPLLVRGYLRGEKIPDFQYLHAERLVRFDRIRTILLFLANLGLIREAGGIHSKFD